MKKTWCYGCCNDSLCVGHCDLPTKHLTVNIGDKLYYNGIAHTSVGIGFQVTVDDEYIETTTNSQYMHPYFHEMDGADNEEIRLCFKAIASGETEIVICHLGDKPDLLIKLDIRNPDEVRGWYVQYTDVSKEYSIETGIDDYENIIGY